MAQESVSKDGAKEATLVSVAFGFGSELSETERTAKNIGKNDFIEVRITNTTPSITVEKITSPADKVLQVLKERGITIEL